MPPTKVVWVTVDISDGKRTFYVSQDEPGSPTYRDASTQPIGLDPHPFSTYSDLCRYIRSFGIDPPAEEHFEPNAREIDYKRTEWTRSTDSG
jgi:hypothetical protein